MLDANCLAVDAVGNLYEVITEFRVTMRLTGCIRKVVEKWTERFEQRGSESEEEEGQKVSSLSQSEC